MFVKKGHAYLHLPGVVATEAASGTRHYLLSDGLGSVRHVTDEAGEVVRYQEFDPYGSPLTEPAGDPYGYTGEWWQADIGLLHLRARWYDPGSGTFLSVDPVESEPPYLYVRGNPTNLVDPSGKNPALCIPLVLADGPLPIGDAACAALIAKAAYDAVVAATILYGGVVVAEEVVDTVEDVELDLDILGDALPDNDPDPFVRPTVVPIPYNRRIDTDDDCDDEDKVGYDLAFGVGTHLFGFANSFQKPTYMFLDWPDEIVQDEAGNILGLANKNIFKVHFHSIMATYFTQVPNGRLKFNLEDMDNTEPDSLTTWELREISTRYYSKVDYYEYNVYTGTKEELSHTESQTKVSFILGGR